MRRRAPSRRSPRSGRRSPTSRSRSTRSSPTTTRFASPRRRVSSRAACARAAAAAHAVAARARSSVPSRAGALTAAGSRAHRRVEGRGWREEVQEGASAAVAHASPRTRANAPRGVHSALTPGGCPCCRNARAEEEQEGQGPQRPQAPADGLLRVRRGQPPQAARGKPRAQGQGHPDHHPAGRALEEPHRRGEEALRQGGHPGQGALREADGDLRQAPVERSLPERSKARGGLFSSPYRTRAHEGALAPRPPGAPCAPLRRGCASRVECLAGKTSNALLAFDIQSTSEREW